MTPRAWDQPLVQYIAERQERTASLHQRLASDLWDLGYICWPNMSTEVIELLMHKGWRLKDIGSAGFDMAGMPFDREDV